MKSYIELREHQRDIMRVIRDAFQRRETKRWRGKKFNLGRRWIVRINAGAGKSA